MFLIETQDMYICTKSALKLGTYLHILIKRDTFQMTNRAQKRAPNGSKKINWEGRRKKKLTQS